MKATHHLFALQKPISHKLSRANSHRLTLNNRAHDVTQMSWQEDPLYNFKGTKYSAHQLVDEGLTKC